jgi:hypothetical protein
MKTKLLGVAVFSVLAYIAVAGNISNTTGLDANKPWIEVLKNMDDNKTDTLTGTGAVSVTTLTTKLVTTGSAQAITLANGRDGQIKIVTHAIDGGSAVLTPATSTGFATITFTNAGDSATLQYLNGRGWTILALKASTITTPTPTATATSTATSTPTATATPTP